MAINNWSSSSLIVEVAAQDDLLPVGADGRVKLATAAAVDAAVHRRRERHSRGGDVDVALGAPDVGRRDGGGRRLSEAILPVGNLERVRLGAGVVPAREAAMIITE